MSESLEVYDQHVGQCPQSDLFSGVLLLPTTVGAEPLVLTIQLWGRGEGRREGGGGE